MQILIDINYFQIISRYSEIFYELMKYILYIYPSIPSTIVRICCAERNYNIRNISY